MCTTRVRIIGGQFDSVELPADQVLPVLVEGEACLIGEYEPGTHCRVIERTPRSRYKVGARYVYDGGRWLPARES